MTRTAGQGSAPAQAAAGAGIASGELDFDGLGDQALLALILRRSLDRPDEAAEALMLRFGALGAVAAADPAELTRGGRIGPAALTDLRVFRELAVRLARIEACRRPVIGSWTALQAYVRTALAYRPREQFRVLFLDHRNKLMQDEMIADGTVDHAPVYVTTVIDCYLALTAGRGARSARQCGPREPGS